MIDYKHIGEQLSITVRESPGVGIDDPKARDLFRFQNAQRIWEIWTQCKLFDEKDRQYYFSVYSGLPTGVVNRYMEVCRKYEEDRATERIKASRAKTASKTSKKSKVVQTASIA